MEKMLIRILFIAILSLGLLFANNARAATLDVGPSGYPYTSIQAAINAAADGDIVLVHDGTYVENVNFSGKAITVKSANGPGNTIIDGSGIQSAVVFNSGEGPSSFLDGFTIRNGGKNDSWGGGIACSSSSPTITNCTITGNKAYAGAGICCASSSSPIISNCTISGNSAFLGGGIYCWVGSSPTITNCTISGNTGGAHSGGIGCDDGCSPIISNCIITGNTAGDGGAIYSYLSSPKITNCTISGNTGANGGGIRCQQGTASVKNSIVWGNLPNEIYLDAGDSVIVTYSDINQDGYAGSNGNMSQDPLFVDSANGDFSLKSTSPCIDAGTSDDAPATDMKGNIRFDSPQVPNTGGGTYWYYDMGALEYCDTGWDSVDSATFSSDSWIYGVHFTSGTEGWAVGGNGAKGLLLHYSGGRWSSVTPPDLGSDWHLDAVHFTSAYNGWAVGDGLNGVVFLHYSAGKWTSVTPDFGSNHFWLYGVQFTSANEGWVVGDDLEQQKGALLHYSRGKWTSVTPPSVSSDWFLRGLHFTSSKEGWSVGMDSENKTGVLLHYSGGTWTPVTPPPIGVNWALRGVHFTSPDEGWAVGVDSTNRRGLLLHYSGGTWISVTPPDLSSNWDLWKVQFTSAQEGWALAYDYINSRGLLLRYSEGKWTSVNAPSVSSDWWLEDFHFTSSNEGWAVGGDEIDGTPVVLHYSVWPEALNSKLNIRGFAQDSNPTEGECHIYPDGTFYLYEDDHGTPRYYTGTYTIDSGKSILFNLDPNNGLQSMKAMLADRITKMATKKGVTVQNISFVFNPVGSFKGAIQKKTNAPNVLTIKTSGTVNASFNGVDKAMSFTYQNTIKYHAH